ncbi:unnamed protein product [Clonostachys chloroleuca]|uniref:Alpha/beta hydrolase fold-3 domain-containing protein n=1 Tax=Clonostachys chloroleuca TaxID=1926264 RepID=A0AA35QB58_9HYPO|nr:unnamed protein product [Clonostachys chloroleuca]
MAGAPKYPIASYQPLKLFFQLFHGSTILARLPLWLLQAVVPALRPHRKWTVKQTLMCRLMYALVDMNSRIGITEPISLKPNKEGGRFQVIDPPGADDLKGPLSTTRASPGKVGATWFPEAPGKDLGSKIIVLYIHGGAFVMGDGREEFAGFAGRNLVMAAKADAVLSLQYRLSGYARRDPFPAALQDALAAYLYLLRELGVPPSQIIFCGDSAGGNLVIALLRYIQEFGGDLGTPAPRCAALFSPWVAPLSYNVHQSPRAHSDFLPTSFLRWGALSYSADLEDPASHPYITPLGHSFKTGVPLFVNVGTAEIFLGDIEKWVKEMQKVEGNQIDFHKEDAALHDTFLLGNVLGFEESALEKMRVLGEFIRNLKV